MYSNIRSTPSAVLFVAFSLALAATDVWAQNRMSPDKQWEFQFSDDVPARIVKAGTTEVALDLSDALSGSTGYNRTPEPVWSPDSKRVAFNYLVHEHRSSGFGTTVLYELRDNKWLFLRSPLDPKERHAAPETGPTDDNRDQLARLAKKYLPKNSYNRRILESPSTGDIFAVIKWTAADTALFWAYSYDANAGALCEFSVNPRGDWKLVKGKVLTGKAAEKQEFHE
ncbi:MAG TPA: hypothetical protein VGM62_07155 [Chthoniobacterales bacterium]